MVGGWSTENSASDSSCPAGSGGARTSKSGIRGVARRLQRGSSNMRTYCRSIEGSEESSCE